MDFFHLICFPAVKAKHSGHQKFASVQAETGLKIPNISENGFMLFIYADLCFMPIYAENTFPVNSL